MISWHFAETLWLHEPQLSPVVERWEEPVPVNLDGGNSRHGKGWKLVTSHMGRKSPAPAHDLQLHNRFAALIANEELGVTSDGASPVADSEPFGTTRRKWQVIMVGDSLLQGTKGFHLLT